MLITGLDDKHVYNISVPVEYIPFALSSRPWRPSDPGRIRSWCLAEIRLNRKSKWQNQWKKKYNLKILYGYNSKYYCLDVLPSLGIFNISIYFWCNLCFLTSWFLLAELLNFFYDPTPSRYSIQEHWTLRWIVQLYWINFIYNVDYLGYKKVHNIHIYTYK